MCDKVKDKILTDKILTDKINKWFCPINPITQVLEHFYKERKKNG